MIVILLAYAFIFGYKLTAVAYSAKQWLKHSNLFMRANKLSASVGYGALVSNSKRP
jgi:hypothetical protein